MLRTKPKLKHVNKVKWRVLHVGGRRKHSWLVYGCQWEFHVSFFLAKSASQWLNMLQSMTKFFLSWVSSQACKQATLENSAKRENDRVKPLGVNNWFYLGLVQSILPTYTCSQQLSSLRGNSRMSSFLSFWNFQIWSSLRHLTKQKL